QYNYDKNGNVLPQGAPITRRYAIHEYDLYFQDSFRIKPNLTLNYGVRYQLETPPWETNGVQVSPTFDCQNSAVGPISLTGRDCPKSFSDYIRLRGKHMYQGITSGHDPIISFNLSGPVNHGPSFYDEAKLNFAPRLSLAYSPRSNSSVLK